MTLAQQTHLQGILIRAHRDFGRRLAARAFFKINNRETCEDLVQQTFMKTWIYLVKGGEIETMKAFLYNILNCLIVDEYRKRKTSSLDVLIEKGFEPKEVGSTNLSNFLDGKEALLLIKDLPLMYRKIVHMRYVQDLSLEEISLITGSSRNTIAVKLHRGLKKIRIIYSARCGKM